MTADLAQWQMQIARELQRAPHDRHHPWRTPVLATCSREGEARARTVVLRRMVQDGAQAHIYTDARSSKVDDLRARPLFSLVFWSPRLNLQLRVQGPALVHLQGPVVDEAWSRMRQAPSVGDYLSARAPGQELDPLAAPPAPAGLGSIDRAAAAHHLAVIECRAESWDALLLDRAGHRRAAWRFDAQGRPDGGRWLVP